MPLLLAALRASTVWAASEPVPLVGPCDAAALPLDVRLSGDWTAEERHRLSAFLCGMLPVLRDLYGDPFERRPVVLAKDPQAAGSWTFSPATMEVRSDGAWDPKLLTHELVHAFRGRGVLTRTSAGRPLPELFGFEEGFAEAVADLALNEYVRRLCPEGECAGGLLPSRAFWTSGLEWTYDFANDDSLATGSLWSDGGGTGKARERYQMAGAALLRLEAAVPAFSRRFNELYLARLRGGEEPSREVVIEILEDLCREMDGLPVRIWVARQRVLPGGPAAGKRAWTVSATPGAGVGQATRSYLHVVETLPDGRDVGVSEAAGILSFFPATEQGAERLFPLLLQEAGGGFPLEELVLAGSPGDCRGRRLSEPLCIDQPAAFGLYRLDLRWLDSSVPATSRLVLAGRAPADYDAARHRFVGGIVGADSGQVVITHSSRPGEARAPVWNGAFYAEVPTCRRRGEDCWVEPYADWSDTLVSVPGTLTFRFTGDDGRSFEEKRTIVYGLEGRHRFLLGASSP